MWLWRRVSVHELNPQLQTRVNVANDSAAQAGLHRIRQHSARSFTEKTIVRDPDSRRIDARQLGLEMPQWHGLRSGPHYHDDLQYDLVLGSLRWEGQILRGVYMGRLYTTTSIEVKKINSTSSCHGAGSFNDVRLSLERLSTWNTWASTLSSIL